MSTNISNSYATKFKFSERYNILTTRFSTLDGVVTFDLRLNKHLEYYSGHHHRFSTFDCGDNYLEKIVITAGKNRLDQSELKIYDITKPFSHHDESHSIIPGCKATISKIKIWNDKLVISDKGLDIYISSFGDFKSERRMMLPSSVIKS